MIGVFESTSYTRILEVFNHEPPFFIWNMYDSGYIYIFNSWEEFSQRYPEVDINQVNCREHTIVEEFINNGKIVEINYIK